MNEKILPHFCRSHVSQRSGTVLYRMVEMEKNIRDDGEDVNGYNSLLYYYRQMLVSYLGILCHLASQGRGRARLIKSTYNV